MPQPATCSLRPVVAADGRDDARSLHPRVVNAIAGQPPARRCAASLPRREQAAFSRQLHLFESSVHRSSASNAQTQTRIPASVAFSKLVCRENGYLLRYTAITVRTFNSQSPSSCRIQNPIGFIGQQTPGCPQSVALDDISQRSSKMMTQRFTKRKCWVRRTTFE